MQNRIFKMQNSGRLISDRHKSGSSGHEARLSALQLFRSYGITR